MQDSHLIDDLRASKYPEDKFAHLQTLGINTYSKLIAALSDDAIDSETRSNLCWAISYLSRFVDRRRVVPPLLKLLDTEDVQLFFAASAALGRLKSKRAIPPLLAIITNTSAAVVFREYAIYALAGMDDPRIVEVLVPLMFEQDEDIRIRSLAIEWVRVENIEYWIRLLSDESPDVRFWAAYQLATAYEDITPALAELDCVAADDHTLPQTWGWHVDREALNALERIYGMPYAEDESFGSQAYLVSPAIEFWTFVQECREMQPDGFYKNLPVPELDYSVDPTWLQTVIAQNWPDAAFNVRDPKPRTYLLDWRLSINGNILLGGLHRDHYALVISGAADAIGVFAVWYRGVNNTNLPLYFYRWADEAVEITTGMTADELWDKVENLH